MEERMALFSSLGFHDSFRMKPQAFRKLLEMMDFDVSSRSHINKETIVGGCIFALAHRAKYRIIEDTLGISHSYAHIMLPVVLRSIIRALSHLISFPSDLAAEKDAWIEDPRSQGRFDEFAGVIGAVDGTLIHFKNPKGMEPQSWWCRKGYNATNAMVVCDAKRRITSFSIGFEGSAHDNRVMSESGLVSRIPQSCFLLGDAGYALLASKILVPYRGTRYHLSEFGGRSPTTREELFNLRHSSLRNIVERCIGRMKGKWRILDDGIVSSVERMQLIGFACVCLHNFLLVENDPLYVIPVEGEMQGNVEHDAEQADDDMLDSIPWASRNAWRDFIANRMWDAYEH